MSRRTRLPDRYAGAVEEQDEVSVAHEVGLQLLVALAPCALFALFLRPEGSSMPVIWLSLVFAMVVAAMPAAVVVLASARPNRTAIWVTRAVIAVGSYAFMAALFWESLSVMIGDGYYPSYTLANYAFVWVGGFAVWAISVFLAHHSAQQRLADRAGQLDELAFDRRPATSRPAG